MNRKKRSLLGLASGYCLCKMLQQQGLCPLNINARFGCIASNAVFNDFSLRKSVLQCSLAKKLYGV